VRAWWHAHTYLCVARNRVLVFPRGESASGPAPGPIDRYAGQPLSYLVHHGMTPPSQCKSKSRSGGRVPLTEKNNRNEQKEHCCARGGGACALFSAGSACVADQDMARISQSKTWSKSIENRFCPFAIGRLG